MQGLTSAQSVAASTALRARWPLPARLTGVSASVATSDALRLCARLMYARKPPTSAIPGTHHPPTSACLTSLSTVCTAIQQAYTGWICTVSHDLDSEQSRQTRTCSPPLLGSKCKDQPHLLNEQPIGKPKKAARNSRGLCRGPPACAPSAVLGRSKRCAVEPPLPLAVTAPLPLPVSCPLLPSPPFVTFGLLSCRLPLPAFAE